LLLLLFFTGLTTFLPEPVVIDEDGYLLFNDEDFYSDIIFFRVSFSYLITY